MVAQDCIKLRILARTSMFTAADPTALRIDVRLSMNSREAISARKWDPPFLTQVSVSWFGRVSSSPASRTWVSGISATYAKRADLCVGVLGTNALLQGAHGIFRRNVLGSDQIRDLEVES